MRGDVLVLEVDEVAWLLKLITLTEALARRADRTLDGSVGERKAELQEWLASRVAGRADATKRPPEDAIVHDDLVTAEEAATMLELTPGAIAKRCRAGAFAGSARKVGGVWMIPAAVVGVERSGR